MIDTSQFQIVPELHGDDEQDTGLLKSMAHDAASYITSFRWATDIKKQYLAFGIGGIVAVFWFEFATKIANSDDVLWVVVGDLPSAYLVAEAGNGPREVLCAYCDLMVEWAEKVIVGAALKDAFPVKAEPTLKNAHALQQRIAFLRKELIPQIPSPE